MSAIIAGGVGAFLGFLLAQGFTGLKAFAEGGFNIITGKDANGKPFKIAIANEALKNPQYDLVKLTATATDLKKPKNGQFKIKNDASGDKRVYTIGVVPDTEFKANGIMVILLNGVRLFPISDPKQGMFSNVSSLNIPIPANFGLKIKESDSLEVFIWNPSAAIATVNFSIFIANIA